MTDEEFSDYLLELDAQELVEELHTQINKRGKAITEEDIILYDNRIQTVKDVITDSLLNY